MIPQDRLSHRCSLHGINYPWGTTSCLVTDCEERLDPLQAVPDEDYALKAELLSEPQHMSLTEASVYTWRFGQLWDAGYDSQVAEILARTHCDLHNMCEVKQQGCSDEQALSIFT